MTREASRKFWNQRLSLARGSKQRLIPPTVFNVYKPVGITSYDAIRHFKKNLPEGYGKIGHFGTLDPFAAGVLLIGVAGSTRLNDYVHEYLPKTYLAVGKLGVKTPTGDMTSDICETDCSENFVNILPKLSIEELEDVCKQFIGQYSQVPPVYSATKHKGKALHEWARDGVDIIKPPVERTIHHLEIVDYSYPYLTLRATVSTGTYIRTLFEDFAKKIGTIGCLKDLLRESIGHISSKNSIIETEWPIAGKSADDIAADWNMVDNGMSMDEVLPINIVKVNDDTKAKFQNGMSFSNSEKCIIEKLSTDLGNKLKDMTWIIDESETLLGLGKIVGDYIKPSFVIPKN